jgi:proteic killer suppression protein
VRLGFEDDDLRRLYVEADFRMPSLGPDLIKHYRKKLAVIDASTDERDLRAMRSLRLEKLVGDRAGQHSIRLNDQWRLIVRLESDDEGQKAIIVEVVDYH